ncbi:MAG: DUF2339 domain-containing protein [Lysinibacillus sp.]
MNEMVSDLKKQQTVLVKQEAERQEKINKQMAQKQQEEAAVKQTVEQPTSNPKVETVHKKNEFDLLKLCQIWLPRIFIGIMLLGVVWLFKAGVDAGILTPPLRLLFGVLLAVGFYWFGNAQLKAKRASLGLVLLGGSVAALVLTTFAAHYLYDYLPAAAAFLLNILWILAGIYMANIHKSEYLAVFVAVGGFFVPFLINSAEPNAYVFLGYETLLTISFLFYAAKKLYRILYFVAYVVSQLVLFVFFALVLVTDLQIEISVIYTLFQVLLYYQLMKDRKFLYNQRLGLLAYNGTVLVLSLINLNKGSTIGLFIIAIAYFALSYLEVKKDKQSTLSSITFALAMFTTAVFFSEQFNQEFETILYLIQGCLAVYVGLILKNNWKVIIGSVIYSFGLILTLITPIYEISSVAFFTHLLLIATFVFILYKSSQVMVSKSKEGYKAFFYSFMMLLFIVVTKMGGAVSDDADVNSLTISFLWMVYASAAIWYGRLKKTQAVFRKNEIIYIGLVVLFITVGKLFLIDLVMVSMTIRAILFLIIGAIGVGISRMFFVKK